MKARLLGFLLVVCLAPSLVAQLNPPSSSPDPSDVLKRHNAIAAARKIPNRNFEQTVPYWTVEGGWNTELQLRNNLISDPLTVIPALRTADGSETTLNPVIVQPGEVRVVDVHQELVSMNSNLEGRADAYGSITLRYSSQSLRNLFASSMIHDSGHPIMYHIDATNLAKGFNKGSREGIWWLPTNSTHDYLVLTNLGDRQVAGKLWLYEKSGKPWSKPLALRSRQTLRLSVRQLLSESGQSGEYGGIKIDLPDGAGSVDSVHILYDETAGFSATMKMFDSNPQSSLEARDFAGTGAWTIRAPMLALAQPDPELELPKGTTLHPIVFVRNTTERPVRVSMALHWKSTSANGISNAPDISLAPFETRLVDVGDLQVKKIVPEDAHWAQTSLFTNAGPDAISAVAASYDSTLRYGAQTPFSEQLSSHLEGGQWKVDATHTSLIAVGNGGHQPVKAELTLLYDRGQRSFQLDQTIAGEDQWFVDVRRLIRDQTPGLDGKPLPAGITNGAYRLKQIDNLGHELLYEGKVVTDKTFGHATYGCMTCCGYDDSDYGLPYLVENPTGLGIGDSEEVDVYGIDACSGGAELIDSYFTTWSSSNTSILTASPESVTGVGLGSAHVTARAVHLPAGDGQDQHTCPFAPAVAIGSGNVVPCPSTTAVNSEAKYYLSAQTTPPNYTGLGSTYGMGVGPNTQDYTGIAIQESVSNKGTGTCNQTWANNICVATGGLRVNAAGEGLGPTGFGVIYPPTSQEFWDSHGFESASNFLSSGSCTIICSQTYSCRGNPIGSYTITLTLSATTLNSVPVTFVNVTKTHN